MMVIDDGEDDDSGDDDDDDDEISFISPVEETNTHLSPFSRNGHSLEDQTQRSPQMTLTKTPSYYTDFEGRQSTEDPSRRGRYPRHRSQESHPRATLPFPRDPLS